MATDATTPSSSPDSSKGDCRPCCSEKTLAYLILRVLLGLLLLLTAADKFKSADSPYYYSFKNWHDEVDAKSGEVIKAGRWLNVAKPVYEFGGLNNPEVFQWGTFLDKTMPDKSIKKGGERISNFIGWVFRAYGLTLPYLMITAGVMVLFGFLNRVGLFLGGGIWMSLAIGQMLLPDNPTVLMLSQYTLMTAVALALVKYNRFSITRF
jgi:hypothetical protein